MFDLTKLIRPNIAALEPYSSARDEYSGKEGIFLDANENPFETGYNRYPDPYQRILKAKLSKIKQVPENNIFLGNGSDEPIDLVFRAFCEPSKHNTILFPPTYGMYKVAAEINNVQIKNVPLLKEGLVYALDIEGFKEAIDKHTRLVFICNPNNPTANSFPLEDVDEIVAYCLKKNIIAVVDEAYIDFSPQKSFASKLEQYPNLVVLQTFSKAWGLAGIRLGMAYCSKEILTIFNKIKYPYNVNKLTQDAALAVLDNPEEKELKVNAILEQRLVLTFELKKFDIVTQIYPSDANFLLIEVENPRQVIDYLTCEKIIVRDRSNVILCEGCLRISIGTKEENNALIRGLKNYVINNNLS